MTLRPIPLDFPIYGEIYLFFISAVHYTKYIVFDKAS